MSIARASNPISLNICFPNHNKQFASKEEFLTEWAVQAEKLGLSRSTTFPTWKTSKVNDNGIVNNSEGNACLIIDIPNRVGWDSGRGAIKVATGESLSKNNIDALHLDEQCGLCCHISHELSPQNQTAENVLRESLIALHRFGYLMHPRPGPKFNGDSVLSKIDHGVDLNEYAKPDSIEVRKKLPTPTIMEVMSIVEICDCSIKDSPMLFYRSDPITAMTIPAHDHGHVFPYTSMPSPLIEKIKLSQNSDLSETEFSPFSTLTIKQRTENREQRTESFLETAKKVASILAKIKESGNGFYWAYSQGIHLVTPVRQNATIDRKTLGRQTLLCFRETENPIDLFKYIISQRGISLA